MKSGADWLSYPRFRPSKALFSSEQRAVVAIVLADKLADSFKVRAEGKRFGCCPGFHPDVRVFDRRLIFQDAKLGSGEPFDDMQRVRVPESLDLCFLIETPSVYQRVSPSQRPMEFPCQE